MKVNSRAMTRGQIGEFIKSPRGIRAFEDVQKDAIDQGDVISSASFLVVSTAPSLGAERGLEFSGSYFSTSDGGANGTFDVTLADSGVTAGAYGGATKTVAISVDAKGRVTSASESVLNTNNITEGSNLYFTTARARTAISNGTGIDYDNSTGVVSLGASGVTAGTYASPTSITVDSHGRITAIS